MTFNDPTPGLDLYVGCWKSAKGGYVTGMTSMTKKHSVNKSATKQTMNFAQNLMISYVYPRLNILGSSRAFQSIAIFDKILMLNARY